MEWVLLTAAGAVVSWIVGKVLDRLLDAWRAWRHKPLTEDGVYWYRWRRLAIAVVALIYVAVVLGLVLTGIVASERSVLTALVAAALFALLVYLWRVVRRRYVRL